jgi:hypothetical protein
MASSGAMRWFIPGANLNRNSLLNRWQIVHRARIPSPDCARRQVSGVDWYRNVTRSLWRSFLRHRGASARLRSKRHSPWSLMVVVEHWWGSDKDVLKTATWARRPSGSTPVDLRLDQRA